MPTRVFVPDSLEFEGSPLVMSEDAEQRMEFNASGILGSGEIIASATIKAYTLTDEVDVSATVISGVSNSAISAFCTIKKIVRDNHYRIEVCVTTNYNKIEGFLTVHGAHLVKT